MTVTDVANAFPLLGTMPVLWPFMMSRFYRVMRGSEGVMRTSSCVARLTALLHLIMPVTGDFGTRGMPQAASSAFMCVASCKWLAL